MGETSVNKLPYPTDANAPDGPTQIKALAEALDALKWGSRNLSPAAGLIQASEEKPVENASYADIPGTTLEITPAVASLLIINATWTFSEASGGPTLHLKGTIRLDSEDQTAAAQIGAIPEGSGFPHSISMPYVLALSAAKHTIKMRARRDGGVAPSAKYAAGSTRYSYLLLAT